MTRLLLAGAGEAAGLAAFLGRLVRWDKAAVVRLRSAEGVLAVFGQPPFGGVLAIRTASLRDVLDLDATVSAGQLLEGIEERIEERIEDGAGEAPDGGGDAVVVPPSVTGPAWAGLLPPRGGWQRVAEFAPEDVRAAAERLVGSSARAPKCWCRNGGRGPSSTRSPRRSGPGRSGTRRCRCAPCMPRTRWVSCGVAATSRSCC